MAEKRSKRHHYIPQGLQKYFTDENGQVWFSELGHSGRFTEPEPRNTKSVFQEKDYYTVLQGGKLSDVVERRHFGPIDDFLGIFLKECIPLLSVGKVPRLERGTEKDLISVVFSMLKRNPNFVERSIIPDGEEEIGRQYFQDILDEIKPTDQIDPAEIEELRKQAEDRYQLRKFGRDIRVRGQLETSPRVDAELENFHVRFGSSKTKASFILPGCALHRVGNREKNGFRNPKMEVWMPISPKHVLILLRDPQRNFVGVNEIQYEKVREVNLFGMRNSSQLASHSKSLLQSVINPR
ncbi:DUF4238 domain-containing protein [Sulfitobacter pacificus]|uniref:DUF4238 domain-containing protein n=1 Tax=Sulfitobacter pacificus TaxID=1499314 RepID=A0ABQ5VJL6_9RHOB|nr:DUF4238 domain-containing protein [Sulfitobacter pacificus]GLQ27218.1 hypothetical protein GCM10007927_20210 [Sulfitobacter pacificus]